MYSIVNDEAPEFRAFVCIWVPEKDDPEKAAACWGAAVATRAIATRADVVFILLPGYVKILLL
jgi:hypothetical protein